MIDTYHRLFSEFLGNDPDYFAVIAYKLREALRGQVTNRIPSVAAKIVDEQVEAIC